MDINDKSSSWNDGESLQSTADPGVSVAVMDEVPTMTLATIVGVTVVILLAIAAVFLLGVLLDCRQQKILEKKMGEVKKMKNHRRVNTRVDSEVVSIANNIEEVGTSIAPAELLREIP